MDKVLQTDGATSSYGRRRAVSDAAFLGDENDPFHPRLLRHTLERLVFIRIFTLTILLTLILFTVLREEDNIAKIQTLCSSIAVVFAVSIVNLMMLRKIGEASLRAFGMMQFAIDVILATGTMAVTNMSVAIFLYLFLIFASALVLGRKTSVSLAAESGICYSLLTAWLYHTGSTSTFADILSVYLALVVVAILSSYLAHRYELVGELAREQANRLSQLRGERAGIFEDLSEGVLLLDEKGHVLELNPSASGILQGISKSMTNALGKPFHAVLEPFTLREDLPRLQEWNHKEGQVEIRLHCEENAFIKHCSLSSRSLPGEPGQPSRGRVVVLSDKSHERTIEERLRLHERMTELLAETTDALPNSALDNYYANMAGESPLMREVFERVERVANSNASVLIEGESGTGKELVARAIHERGSRHLAPFVAVNCGALPENLIESEFFGHKRGAFTGATQDSQGLFRQANGGTLFLDEIGELPLLLQTKLLRVLQEKSIRAVGDTKDYPVDVRVLAATNRDLKAEVKAGRFREDLYYRLNVVNIALPPLRERKNDIPLLVRHFLKGLCPDNTLPQVSPEALQLLMLYPFPGNIRELENIVERALVFGGNAILPEHLPEELRSKSSLPQYNNFEETQIISLPIDLEKELEALERAYLMRALEQSQGIKKNAAEMLGLNFRSFRYRLKKYSLASENGERTDDGDEDISPTT